GGPEQKVQEIVASRDVWFHGKRQVLDCREVRRDRLASASATARRWRRAAPAESTWALTGFRWSGNRRFRREFFGGQRGSRTQKTAALRGIHGFRTSIAEPDHSLSFGIDTLVIVLRRTQIQTIADKFDLI